MPQAGQHLHLAMKGRQLSICGVGVARDDQAVVAWKARIRPRHGAEGDN